jgi:SAM-dependent methyltransferase
MRYLSTPNKRLDLLPAFWAARCNPYLWAMELISTRSLRRSLVRASGPTGCSRSSAGCQNGYGELSVGRFVEKRETAMSTDTWSGKLNELRKVGRKRAREGNPSRSMLMMLDELPDDCVVLDVGCGDSPDRLIARQLGLVAYGVDLFLPTDYREHFISGSAFSLPFKTASIDGIASHSMISLVAPEDRWDMYDEFARVLKVGGLLAIGLYELRLGYATRPAQEDHAIINSGFKRRKKAALYERVIEPAYVRDCVEMQRHSKV